MTSPVTVTATLNDPSGSALVDSTTFVRFRLRNYQGFIPYVSGTAILAETQIDAFPNDDGQISQELWPNSAITPSTTFYTVEYWHQNRITSSGNYLINGNTNLNTAAQLNAPPVPPGFELVLQNNGADNSSQSTLNLENTDGSIIITDEGDGTLNLQAQTASFSGDGAFLIGAGIRDGLFLNQSFTSINANRNNSTLTANRVIVYLFQLSVEMTISKVSAMASNNSEGVTGTFGIYNYAGNLLVNGGSFNEATSPAVQTNDITPVTLPPGTYWHAQASSSNSSSATFYGLPAGATIIGMYVANTTRAGYAANTLSGGVLPSTLGTITAFTPNSGDGDGFCCPLYE